MLPEDCQNSCDACDDWLLPEKLPKDPLHSHGTPVERSTVARDASRASPEILQRPCAGNKSITSARAMAQRFIGAGYSSFGQSLPSHKQYHNDKRCKPPSLDICGTSKRSTPTQRKRIRELSPSEDDDSEHSDDECEDENDNVSDEVFPGMKGLGDVNTISAMDPYEINGQCYVKLWTDMVIFLQVGCPEEKMRAFLATPFGAFLRLTSFAQHRFLLDDLLNYWDNLQKGFIIAGKVVPFTVNDVCLITGLKANGSYIFTDHYQKSRTFLQYAKESEANGSRSNIKKLFLKALALDKSVQEAIQLMLLYLFATVLFPNSSSTCPKHLYYYVDDLSSIDNYAWGIALYENLLSQLQNIAIKSLGRMYSPGCTIVLMAWLCEHVHHFGKIHHMKEFPRMLRWQRLNESRKKKAQQHFASISPQDVITHPLTPKPCELRLLEPQHQSEMHTSEANASQLRMIRNSIDEMKMTIVAAIAEMEHRLQEKIKLYVEGASKEMQKEYVLTVGCQKSMIQDLINRFLQEQQNQVQKNNSTFENWEVKEGNENNEAELKEQVHMIPGGHREFMTSNPFQRWR